MSGIEVVGLVISSFAIASKAFSGLHSTSSTFSDLTLEFRQDIETYGLENALILGVFARHARSIVQRIDKYLIGKGIEETAFFKTSFNESFTMVAVAGAIIAQTAITGLSLPNLSETPWTAYAAFVISLITGCLSVYYSCAIQAFLGGIHSPEDILAWLANRRFRLIRPPHGPKSFKDRMMTLTIARWIANQVAECPDLDPQRVPYINAALMLAAPSELLNASLAALLVGLGIYLGLTWSKGLSAFQGSHAALAILIMYVVVTFGALTVYFYPAGLKILELQQQQQQAPSLQQGPKDGEIAMQSRRSCHMSSLNMSDTEATVDSGLDDLPTGPSKGRQDSPRRWRLRS